MRLMAVNVNTHTLLSSRTSEEDTQWLTSR